MKSKVLNREEMINAIRDNNKEYDGQFFLAVMSTGIFCLPSCRARDPLEKNMKFYDKKEDALNDGFRGCKRCRSEFYPDVEPPWLSKITDFIHTNKNKKIELSQLANLVSVHESTIYRYFKEYLGTTPLAYHNKLMMEYARKRISGGEDYRDVAFELGFESISGFREAFARVHTINPGEL